MRNNYFTKIAFILFFYIVNFNKKMSYFKLRHLNKQAVSAAISFIMVLMIITSTTAIVIRFGIPAVENLQTKINQEEVTNSIETFDETLNDLVNDEEGEQRTISFDSSEGYFSSDTNNDKTIVTYSYEDTYDLMVTEINEDNIKIKNTGDAGTKITRIEAYKMDDGSDTCFLKGTNVLMADGSYKNIEDIKTGDIVKSYDIGNNYIVDSIVTNVHHHKSEEMTNYYLLINNDLRVTPNHRFYSNNNWVEAGNLRVGDLLFTSSLDEYKISSIQKIYDKKPSYDLTVNDEHNYFVNILDECVLVHNDQEEQSQTDTSGGKKRLYNMALKRSYIQGAQSFTPQTDYTLSRVDVYIGKNGNPGDIKLGIYDDLNEEPLEMVQITGVASGPSWVTFNLNNGVSLNSGTKYYIIVMSISGDGSNNFYEWYFSSNDIYRDHMFYTKTDKENWTPDRDRRDFAFKTYSTDESEQYTLTISVTGRGTTDPSGTNIYDSGTPVTITANPDKDFDFDHWEGDLEGSENPVTITMKSDKTITAVFTGGIEQHVLELSTDPSGSGYITIAPPPSGTPPYNYNHGTVLEITAEPWNQDWYFYHWEGDLTGSTNPAEIVMDEDKSITAVFIDEIPTQELVADFTWSPTTPRALDDTVYFEDHSIPSEGNTLQTWTWNFGDECTSTEQNPTHVYDEAGRYIVKLTVADNSPVSLNVFCEKEITVAEPSSSLQVKILSPYNGYRTDVKEIAVQTSVDSRYDVSYFLDWNRTLVGYWNFESSNSCKDNSTYSNSGNVGGGDISDEIEQVPGKLGNGSDYEGYSYYMEVPKSNSLNIEDELTIEAWVKIDTNPSTDSIILCKDDVSMTDKCPYKLSYDDGANIIFTLSDGSNIYQCSYYSGSSITGNGWHHIAATYDKKDLIIYVDGKLKNTETIGPITIDTPKTDVYIGGKPTGNYFNGKLDEVRLWKRALNLDEISNSYNVCTGEIDEEIEITHNFYNLIRGRTYKFYAHIIDKNGVEDKTHEYTIMVKSLLQNVIENMTINSFGGAGPDIGVDEEGTIDLTVFNSDVTTDCTLIFDLYDDDSADIEHFGEPKLVGRIRVMNSNSLRYKHTSTTGSYELITDSLGKIKTKSDQYMIDTEPAIRASVGFINIQIRQILAEDSLSAGGIKLDIKAMIYSHFFKERYTVHNFRLYVINNDKQIEEKWVTYLDEKYDGSDHDFILDKNIAGHYAGQYLTYSPSTTNGVKLTINHDILKFRFGN